MFDTYESWKKVLADASLPTAIVDLDALDANQDLLARAVTRKGLRIRVASKSIRSPWILRYILEHPGFDGLMAFSAHEAELLVEEGFDDILLAYPISRPDEAGVIAELNASGAHVVAMADHRDHLALLDRANRTAAPIPVCVDVDVALRPAGDHAHLGVRRSPLRSPGAVVALARKIHESPGLRFEGIMAYEAQVAGLPDPRGRWGLRGLVQTWIKRRSIHLASERRLETTRALGAAGLPPRLVNGGGSGSIVSTSKDASVTEITAGSGFFAPHLFDDYHDLPFTPSAFFALSVCRLPGEGHVTCAGGGYVASGAIGSDRLPIVHSPPGLVPLPREGWGEVQTPLRVGPACTVEPRIGDPVICRHAKAGELAERFDEFVLIRGQRIIGRAPTYRGLGACFP